MRVGILGFSKAVQDAPFADPSWTLWGMNGLWRVLDKVPPERFSRWFEPHTPAFLEEYGVRANIGTQQQDWLAAVSAGGNARLGRQVQREEGKGHRGPIRSSRPRHSGANRRIARSVMRHLCAMLLSCFVMGCAAKITVPIAAGADLVTTEIAIAHGATEINPVMESTALRISMKALASVLVVWLCNKLDAQGHKGWSNFVQWFATGAWAGAAGWNLSQVNND